MEMMASLGTDSLAEARELSAPYVSGWRAWFKALERGDTKITPEEYVKRAKVAAGVILNGLPGDLDALPPLTPQAILRRAQDAAKEVSEGSLRRFDAVMSFDQDVDTYSTRTANPSEDDLEIIQRASRAVRGELGPTLKEELKVYLSERRGSVTESYLTELEKRCQAFVEWVGGDAEVTEVSRKKAGKFVAEVIQARDVSPATKIKEASALRSWFHWLLLRGVVESNPFDKMTATIKKSKRGEQARRPWTQTELMKVLQHIDASRSEYRDNLVCLMLLCLYTGARREEIGKLRVEDVDVDGGAVQIREGKSDAAVRTVPIHPAIAGIVDRLVKNTGDGYLLTGLTPGGKDKKRTHKLGDYFGQQKRASGVTDRRVVLHSLRNTFITAMTENEVPESTTQQIVGHERPGVTASSYTAGVSLKKCTEAISALSFGPVDAFAKSHAKAAPAP